MAAASPVANAFSKVFSSMGTAQATQPVRSHAVPSIELAVSAVTGSADARSMSSIASALRPMRSLALVSRPRP